MKFYQKIKIAMLIAIVFLAGSCKKLLEEHPQSAIVPSFFNTPAGVLGGIAGVYNDIRSIWGTEGWSSQQSASGTDEVLMAASASGQQFYNYNGLTSGLMNGGVWNVGYQDINTLNGVLQFGTAVDLPDATKKAYLAQAKFLRAFWYYHLVQMFGDVPLHLEFITKASSADTRQPLADVYTQIIKDLTEAAADMPNTPTSPFLGKAACKSTALFLLGKTYLARGWSSAVQPTDFQNAYTTLTGIITNKATYGLDLWQDFADAFKPGPLSVNTNDYGKESLFVSDHSIDQKFGQYVTGGAASGGAAQNLTPWFNRWNYPSFSGINSNKNVSGVMANAGSAMMTRDVLNGRPYIRTRPNHVKLTTGPNAGKSYILDQAFADRVNDSRYDKTFQTVWLSNLATANTAATAGNTRGISYTMAIGVDTAVWFTDFEIPEAPQFIGTRPFKGLVIPPSLWNNNYFPAVRKFDDPFRAAANFNDPSTRPVVLWRFSDVYMSAAEAAFKAGDLTNAAAMINAVRQRAAFRTTNSAAQNAAAVAAVTILPAQVTLDFILDERTREFYGEWQRWFDLVRTKSLLARVAAWNPVEAGTNIRAHHVLRPIPQQQIDLVTEGPPFPQNTGY